MKNEKRLQIIREWAKRQPEFKPTDIDSLASWYEIEDGEWVQKYPVKEATSGRDNEDNLD